MNLAEQSTQAASQVLPPLVAVMPQPGPQMEIRRIESRGSSRITWLAYALFIGAVSFACYLRPISDDFDRYVYEAIVRERHEPLTEVYERVKHESPRAEASTILDSSEHLEKLEPLYKIRPIYLALIEILSGTGISIQQAINLISAASLLGIGILLAAWTEHPGLSALFMLSPIMTLGRMGTPDALSTLIVLAAVWAMTRERIHLGCILMLLAVWVRTDNAILLVLSAALFGWRKIPLSKLAIYCAAASLSVVLINHSAANYGWAVLFRWSFLPGAHSPADITPHVAVAEYARVFLQSLFSIVGRLAIWVIFGISAWLGSTSTRRLLILAALGTATHFVLYPSPEDRYLIWAYLVVAIAFIEWVSLSLAQRQREIPGTI